MFKFIKRAFLFLVIAVVVLFMFGDDEEDIDTETEKEIVGEYGDDNQTWSIYWYLCGSDLESDGGMATEDLQEMMEVDLPENVNVIIQTGGASQWQNDIVDASVNERYLYSSEGLELLEQQPMANMGEEGTLADFLTFCKDNYPADKTAVIFWNHGGGSVSGAAFDENFGYDALTLTEFYHAFDAAYDLSLENPPIDVIGFDTCLMATIDTAYTFADIGNYLVASEELEPGGGWNYTGWLEALAKKPGMDGAILGQEICDSYMEGCEEYWAEDEATLSVIDLTKTGPLFEAYEAMGAEALKYALEDYSFFGDFGRQAVRSENYGGNTRDQGYSNMVDLGHLAKNCEDILPRKSKDVIESLEECVVYKVNGVYRENAQGLSCYFSYNGDLRDLHGFQSIGCSDAFKYLYDYGLEGKFTDEGIEFLDSLGYADRGVPEAPEVMLEEEYPLELDDEQYAVMEIDDETMDMLKGVYFQLAYVNEEEDIMYMLGQDNDIDADWDKGIFKDNFRGVWGAIDGHFVYMEVAFEDENTTVYSVPILLNGEAYNLRVIYDFNDEKFHIKGARKAMDESGMADKNLVQLKPGDEITTIHYSSSISGDDDFVEVPMETFTVTEDTSFNEKDMTEGTFLMMFELIDTKNNSSYSQMVQFDVDGDDFEIEILE